MPHNLVHGLRNGRRQQDLLRQVGNVGVGNIGAAVASVLSNAVSHAQSIPRPFPAGVSATAINRAVHEPKNVDITTSFNISGSTINVTLLNACNQGITGNTRTGRQIELNHLRLNLGYFRSTSSPVDTIRVLVIYDRECRGSSPGNTDLFANTTFGFGQLLSAYNFDNVPTRFKILMDELYDSNATVTTGLAGTAWVSNNFTVKREIKLKGKTHFYNTSGSGVVDIDSGSIYLVHVGALTTNTSNVTVDSRIVFRDL